MINYTLSNLQMKVDFSMEVEVLKYWGHSPSGRFQGEVEIAKVVCCISFHSELSILFQSSYMFVPQEGDSCININRLS